MNLLDGIACAILVALFCACNITLLYCIGRTLGSVVRLLSDPTESDVTTSAINDAGEPVTAKAHAIAISCMFGVSTTVGGTMISLISADDPFNKSPKSYSLILLLGYLAIDLSLLTFLGLATALRYYLIRTRQARGEFLGDGDRPEDFLLPVYNTPKAEED